MKCTQCGCEQLTRIHTPFSADYWEESETLKIYSCNECGHLEFFDNGINEIRKECKQKQTKKDELTRELEKTLQPIVELENELQDEKEKLQKLLENKDITIRQQENSSAEINLKIKDLTSEIDNKRRALKHDINELETELYHIESEIGELLSEIEIITVSE